MYNSRYLYISLQETLTTGIWYSVYTLKFNKEHFLKVEVFVIQLVLYIINMLATHQQKHLIYQLMLQNFNKKSFGCIVMFDIKQIVCSCDTPDPSSSRSKSNPRTTCTTTAYQGIPFFPAWLPAFSVYVHLPFHSWVCMY